MDPRVEILLKEYETLRREEFLHKESLRRVHLLIVTAVTTFIGAYRLGENIAGIASSLLVPVVLISMAYGLHDLYQIFVIARHVGIIEERVNGLIGVEDLLSWETRTCRRMFGRPLVTLDGPPRFSILQPSIFADGLVGVFGVPAVIFASIRVLESIESPWLQGLVLVGLTASLMLLLLLSLRVFRLIRGGRPLGAGHPTAILSSFIRIPEEPRHGPLAFSSFECDSIETIDGSRSSTGATSAPREAPYSLTSEA